MSVNPGYEALADGLFPNTDELLAHASFAGEPDDTGDTLRDASALGLIALSE